MQDRPFIGQEREEWATWTCGYAAVPGAVHCGRDVIWHGIALDDTDTVGMGSCDEHLPQMKLSADYVHPHQHPCGMPGSLFRWPENECYTDWDEAAEFAAEAEVTA